MNKISSDKLKLEAEVWKKEVNNIDWDSLEKDFKWKNIWEDQNKRAYDLFKATCHWLTVCPSKSEFLNSGNTDILN